MVFRWPLGKLSGLVSISGPLMVAFGIAWFGLESFFLMLAAVLLLMAVISIWRVLTVPALAAGIQDPFHHTGGDDPGGLGATS